jgi:hypothetical protein
MKHPQANTYEFCTHDNTDWFKSKSLAMFSNPVMTIAPLMAVAK